MMSTGTQRQRTVRPSPALFVPDFSFNQSRQTITTSGIQILTANVNRYSLFFQADLSAKVYIGPGEVPTINNAIIVLSGNANEPLLYKDFPGIVGLAWFAITLVIPGPLHITEVIHRPKECR